jgi:DNA-binding CsgD family transcriptional regulator/predicted negative regulator of RcsB-dependent stress response
MTSQGGHWGMAPLGADQSVTFDRRQQTNQLTRRLMERDEWQDELAASFAGLLPPSAVIIEGEPGLGKTAFLNAACHVAREAGHDVLYARGGALESESPFGIVRQLFQPAEATLSPNEHEMCANVTTSLSDVRRPIPFEVIHDLYLNLAHFASSRPIVIAIDDLQWSDYESLVWVQYVVRRLESGRISFIGSSTCRVAGTALAAVDNIIAEPSTRVFSLRPLSVDSVTKLVGRQLNVDSEDSFARACHTITGGNPFLLHSLLSALEREGFGPDVSEESLATLSPPPVARAILRRLGGLPEEAHALMQAAAILGDESDHRVVAALAGVDASLGSDMANALAEVYLLRRDRPLSFVHPLERSTVYGEIDPVRRARAHAEAARLLDDHGAPLDQVAHHLLLAEPSADEWSGELLERAALVHAKEGQYEFAVRCLARSLDESLDSSTRSRRLLELSSAEAAMGRPTALDHLREAAELGVDPIELADATYRCLRAFAQESYPPETVATLRHLEAQLGDGHVDLRIWIEIVLSTWDQQPPALPASTPAIESVLLRKQTERTRLDRLALAHLAYVKTFASDQATAEYVADLAEQAVGAVDLQLDDCTSIVVAARAVASLVRAGRFEVADRLGLMAQTAAVRDDQQTAVAEFSTVLAYSHFLQGNLDEAEIECRRSLAAMEGRSWASRPMSLGVLAATFIEEGRSREAASVLKDAVSDSIPRTIAELLALEQRAKLKMLEGRIDEALKDLLLAEQGAEALGVRNPAVTSWRSVAATALCAAERTTEARDLAGENLELARAFGAPWALGMALRTAAEVGDPLDRLELLTEAVGVLEPAGASLECAKATIDLGSVLISKGRQDEALSTLRRGADLAFRCRAQPLADRAARELRAAGARPRRLALMGSDALTPAERRVAELAAGGMINARIAEALFVSEKTVEGHLTRVYQKLGRRSRTNLREVFKPLPEIASTSASTELRAV